MINSLFTLLAGRPLRLRLFGLPALALLCIAAPAEAQLTRVGGTVPVLVTRTSGTNVAHDPVNDLYLIVQGYGPVYGTFVDPSGQPVTASFAIHVFDGATFGLLPAVAYSPDVSNGAGGTGGFLVTWHQGAEVPVAVFGAIVAYEAPGRIVRPEFRITDPADPVGTSWLCWPAVAYSRTSRQFLVSWNGRDWSIRGRLLGTDGSPTSNVLLFENPGGSRDPAVAWNSASNEFGLIYSMWNYNSAWAAFRRIGLDGTVYGRTSFGFAPGTYATGIDVTLANNYVVAWGLGPGTMTAVFDQSGAQISPESLATTRLGGDLSLGMAYNAASGTFLVVSSDYVGYEVGALELDGGGLAMGGVLTATEGGLVTAGSYYPKPAARANAQQWNIVYARNLSESANQIVASVSVGVPVCSVSATATVPPDAITGASVPFVATATATGCGAAAPTYSWSFGDSSLADPNQNTAHTYGAPGTYYWTLTATVGTAVAVKTGTINVLPAGACVPSVTTVAAKPSTASLDGMWQATGLTVTAGQLTTVTVAGTQTWINGGQAYTAAGNQGDITSGGNVPMPGAPRMALVGRIGTAGAPFLVGTLHQLTASATGELYLAPNDDWYLIWDNSGSLSVSVCAGGTACSVDVATTVPTSSSAGSPVAFAATGTPTGCGAATPTYSWHFGDGSAPDTAQNATHVYANPGTYTWTLTVVVGTAVETRTGSITVSGTGDCTPVTGVVLAQPSPQTLAAMWQATSLTVAAGQLVTVSVGGVQTWVSAGQSFPPAGNPADPASGGDVPMPGSPRMALVGRIGTSGAPFLVGAFAQFTATAAGQLYLAPNDDWYALWDNSGSLSVTACTGGTPCAVSATATAPASSAPGAPVAFAGACSPTGCGAATPTYSWDFGDGSPVSTAQNPTHAYADPGTYTWTLTVVVATASTTRTGTITVSYDSACTPVSGLVLAQPSPQTLTGMWQGTSVNVTAGQVVMVSVGGTQTWVSGGQSYTAAGNPADITSGTNVPMPGAPRMALVGRIGTAGTPFLVGPSTQFTASTSGQLYLAPNDDWYLLWDNSGSLTVSACAGSATCSVNPTASVPTTAMIGSPVAFAGSCSPAGCGAATPAYSWTFGDGSPGATAQNVTHAYATAGTYTWTLTVTVGTTTATRNGTVTVSAGTGCTPVTATVVALPSPQSLSAMWQGTGASITAGQTVTITVGSGQSWVSAGQSYSAAGNPADPTAGANSPMAGAPRMALVGRIGATGTPFLIGTSTQFTAQATGELLLAPNDDWYLLWDNSGSLSVSVCAGTEVCSVSVAPTVPTSATIGNPVPFAATGTPSGCGAVTPSYTWDFGDGSPLSTAQNPTHVYSAVGSYNWTLTVQAGSATEIRTGTISVSTGPSCTTTTAAVLAQPSSQTLDGMWQVAGVPIGPGDVVTITVSAGQTWFKGGQAWSAAGNPADPTVGGNSPMPGAPRMALVGRISPVGQPFLVGPSLQFTAQATGQLFLAPNDDWYLLWSNSGSLTVTICR